MSSTDPKSSQGARATARFPEVPDGRGHYESFYLKAGDPDAPRAVWIRYTVHKRPRAQPTGSLWFTLFDAEADGPRASKVTVGADRIAAGGGDYLRIADGRFGPGRVVGTARTDALEAEWDLTFEPGAEPFRHLPRAWMYTAPLPRTKLESPHPGTSFSGRVRAGDRTIELNGWPGVVGHNWGREHAERWIWMHGTGFEESSGEAWLDAAIGRIKVGPLTSPWVANAQLVLDGDRHRLGGLERVRSTTVSETPHRCDFVLPGHDLTVRGTVEAAPSDVVGWVYADPDGPEHNTANCSIASMRLEVERPGAAPRHLSTAFGATYELGMRERDHGVPLQPFPDG
jgi:hypothetical protein